MTISQRKDPEWARFEKCWEEDESGGSAGRDPFTLTSKNFPNHMFSHVWIKRTLHASKNDQGQGGRASPTKGLDRKKSKGPPGNDIEFNKACKPWRYAIWNYNQIIEIPVYIQKAKGSQNQSENVGNRDEEQ